MRDGHYVGIRRNYYAGHMTWVTMESGQRQTDICCCTPMMIP